MLRAKIIGFGQKCIERGAWYFAPLSLLYAFGVMVRNRLYDWGFFQITRVDKTVVSVGNIVAGGTGKTPFVHLLARQFPGRKIAILSRGYGEMPDEAMLLARRLPEVKVYVGKNRAKLAKEVDAELVILDDGFQHRKLYRDVDVVLVKEGKERYLPWGFLRDQPTRLEKAEVFKTNEFELTVKRILDLKGRQVPSIRGWKVAIFCGIAHPLNFKKTVEGLGAEVIAEKFFADHEVAELSKLPKVSALICTEKDYVKLPPTELPIYFLEMEMEFVGDRAKWEKLIEKIDQKIDNKHTYE